MATDAEINLKVNIPQPKGQDIEKMLADIKRLGSFTRDYLKESAKGADIAEAAKIGRERAAKVGEEVAKNWEKGFADGFKNVATMGRAQQKISLANEAIYSDVTKAEAAWREGKLTDQQMVALLTRRGEQQNAVYDKAGNLKNMVGGAESDLQNLGQMEELLTKHERFSEAMRGEAEGARALALELRNSAGALEDEAEALDLSISGNEKRKLQLLQLAKDERTRANAVEKSAEVIDAETAAIDKNIAAVDGSADSYEKANNAIDRSTVKALDQKKKLVELGAKQAVSTQKQVVEEIQLAEQQERRAVAEAKRAKQEEMLREKEIFQNSLLGKKKLELAKIISDLNKQRKEAVKIGDAEAIERLNMQYSIARSAMRSASMQANVTRMMFMQQAQTASRLSSNISTLAQGFTSLSNFTKTGELNITGMASSLMDLWFAMKAGMGPVGWLMAALQGVQSLIKKYSEITNFSTEQEKHLADSRLKTIETYQTIAKIQDDINKKQAKEEMLRNLASTYQSIADNVKTAYDNIKNTYEIEGERSKRLDRNLKTELQLLKMELEKQKIAGKITDEEYIEGLAKYDKDAALKQNKITLDNAQAALEMATSNLEVAKKESEEANTDLTNQTINASQFPVSLEVVEILKKEEEEAKSKMETQLFTVNKMYEDLLKLGERADSLPNGVEKMLTRLQFEYDKTIYDTQRQYLEKLVSEYNDKKSKRENILDGHDVDHYIALYEEANAFLDAAKTRANNAEKDEKKRREELEEAQKNRSEASRRYEENIETINKLFNANQQVRFTQDAEKVAKKDRASFLEKITKNYQEKSLKELSDIRKDIRKEREKEKVSENSDQWNQYQTHIDKISDRIREIKENQREVISAAKVEAQNEGKAKQVAAIDMQSVFAAIRDGVITVDKENDINELKIIADALKQAIKADNSVLREYLSSLLEAAEYNKKNSAETRKKISTTRKKLAR